MLEITIPEKEYFDEKNSMFFTVPAAKIQLEHSLLSISKWEAKWHKSYFLKEKKTAEEIMDYIRCMTITQNVNPAVYNNLTASNFQKILEYIEDPMTATTFNDPPGAGKKKQNHVYTSEEIYYWMLTYNIPFECQKWHIHRLLTLIRVCNIKSQDEKKMSKSERAAAMARRRELNASRRSALNSRG